MSTHEHWQSRPEGGGRFALWLIRTIALRGGRRLGRLCL
jgi:predicted LPLAT superfamily acyltransferase